MISETAGNPFGFDTVFLRKLERISLLNRRPLTGPFAGRRRSIQRGVSVEFADFRDYAPGDDIRRVDWKAYGRLDRLFLRLYVAEQMTGVNLFLDHSTSMHYGQPSKALTAARVAAMLSFIALDNHDRVAVFGWADRLDHRSPAESDRRSTPRVWQDIWQVMSLPAGQTDFAALSQLGSGARHDSGLSIVLSDFLTDSDWQSGLRALRSRGQEVTAIQILSPEELHPDLRGDWTLRDAENGAEVEVTVSPRLLGRYEQELAALTNRLRDYCRRQGIAFLQLVTSESLPDEVLGDLQSIGMVA